MCPINVTNKLQLNQRKGIESVFNSVCVAFKSNVTTLATFKLNVVYYE